MKTPKFSPVELRIMDALWSNGACSVREIHESLPETERPAFTTIQTMVYRLEAKHALRCTKRVGNANIFEAVVSRDAIEHRFLNDVLAFLGGGPKRVMAHLIDTGQLTLADIEDAEQRLRALKRRKARTR
jgi:BlaI family transcriptional regulator, penicillinase repressor